MTVASAELLEYDDVISRYEPVMGMEVHVELSTATKMFCGCANEFGAEPNTQVCPVCLGLPGSLPVVNAAAVESAIRIGLALNCDIAPWGRFARKNYFYPDQPKNYQISQYDEPIAINGYLDVPLDDGTIWRVEIERAHMEEDTGKLTHLGSDTGRIEGATTSLLDYNRAGVPLVEIVTKPIEGTGERAPQIARAYVTALRDLLRALGVSDVRMDQGSMRVDSNVSPEAARSHRIRYQDRDQERELAQERRGGGPLRDAAPGSDSGGGRPNRAGDAALPGGRLHHGGTQQGDRAGLPVLPRAGPRAGGAERGARRAAAGDHPGAALVAAQADSGRLGHLRRGDARSGQQRRHRSGRRDGRGRARPVRPPAPGGETSWCRRPTKRSIELDELAITPVQVAAVVKLVDDGKLSNKLARQVIEGVLAGEGEPEQVMTDRGLAVVRDDSVIQAAVDEALAANPDIAEKIRGGKVQAAGAIVGAVMKATKGQADAAQVRELVLAACA